ncbi:hypothetical protein D918_05551 [Trichuris suis]|nr:hypothetical protein D918_05551 [Trichuris suis]
MNSKLPLVSMALTRLITANGPRSLVQPAFRFYCGTLNNYGSSWKPLAFQVVLFMLHC